MRMFVGLDVHKKYTQVAIVDEEGVVTEQERIENEPALIEEFSNRLSTADMVMESSSTWYWLYEILSRKHRVVVSNPAKTKAIASAKLKTDKVDALMLCKPAQRRLYSRELCAFKAHHHMEPKRARTVQGEPGQDARQCKDRVHAYLLMNNIKIDYSPFTKGFLEELGKVEDGRVQGYLRIIERLNLEIHEASKRICGEALSD